MALEVAELLPLPSRYRRPDGTWPTFSFYSELGSCTGSVTWFIYLYFLCEMSDSILQGQMKYWRACDITVSSITFWGLLKSDFCVCLLFWQWTPPQLSFFLGWATCFAKLLYFEVLWDWCSGGFQTLAAIKAPTPPAPSPTPQKTQTT